MIIHSSLSLGDVLLFNPTEPHCVSSRCRNNEDVYCLSSYVKSAVVSGNDNEQIVTGEVERLAGFYPALKLLAAIYVIFLLFLTFKQVLFW